MDDIVISVEKLSKKYDLGVIGTGTFSRDLNRWWARLRRRPDPYAKIGEVDHGNRLGQTILALDDVSFAVNRGEVLGIIGRNGAGKSTLLKILSQVTAPSSGKVKIKGRIGSLLEVGTGFHPELTGRENLYLNGAILGMSKAEVNRKFDEIVEFSGVEKFIDTPVKRYSSGMYVRLAFAVAAHLEPEILIVDEVLAVGDAEFQKKCLGKMSDVAHEGRTVLFVSHNMGAVRKLCSQVMLMDKGSKLNFGATDIIIDQYLNEHTGKNDSVIEMKDKGSNVYWQGRAVRILIKDEQENLRNVFKIGEKWVIRLEFEIYTPLNHVIAAIGLNTSEAISLVTFWSKPSSLNPGKYAVEFLCDLAVKATNMSLVVGLSDHENTFYYVEDVGSVEVAPVSINEEPFRTSGAGILLGNQDSLIFKIED